VTGRILIAEVGGERIFLLLEQVAEVLEHTSSFPLPLAPPFLDRAISAKGCLTPILDMGRFLGWSATRSPGRILVMVGDGVNLALHVDRVTDIVSADTVLGEKPSVGEPFASLLVLPCGEAPLLSSGQLLRMLERSLAGSRRETGHENIAG
jgi:hypothetical protein